MILPDASTSTDGSSASASHIASSTSQTKYSAPPTLEEEEERLVDQLNPEARKKILAERERLRDLQMDGGGEEERVGFGRRGESEEEARTRLVEELPPFQEYRPKYRMDRWGNIWSHDEHLASSGEALFQFLKLQATSSPGIVCDVMGSHKEHRDETVWKTQNGRQVAHQRKRSATVVDFQFSIPLLHSSSSSSSSHGILYAVPPEVPCYRGGMQHTLGYTHEGIRLEDENDRGIVLKTKRLGGPWNQERKLTIAKERERLKRGLPGWLDHSCLTSSEILPTPTSTALFGGLHLEHSTHATAATLHVEQTNTQYGKVRVWCQDFADSLVPFKEMIVEKKVFGFDFREAEKMIGEVIRSQAPYSGKIEIKWTYTSSRISISGSSKWNKVFTLPIPIRILLTFVFVYPILLLLRLFFGSRYTTVRIGFPIRQWRFIKGSENVTSGEEALRILRNSWERGAEDGARLVRPAGSFPEGWWWEEGMGEDEWTEKWTGQIVDGVRRGRQGGMLKSGGVVQRAPNRLV